MTTVKLGFIGTGGNASRHMSELNANESLATGKTIDLSVWP